MSRSISFLTSHVNRALLATLALAAFTLASPLQAQTYPTKPIKAIVPFAPGSATDQIGRAFAAKMSEQLGQPIVVENKPGVNGMLGADAVAKSPADGYTLLIGTNSTNAALKSLMNKLPYDQDTAFAPVGFMGSVPLIVGVNPSLPYKTLREFVDGAKVKPGAISFAMNHCTHAAHATLGKRRHRSHDPSQKNGVHSCPSLQQPLWPQHLPLSFNGRSPPEALGTTQQ